MNLWVCVYLKLFHAEVLLGTSHYTPPSGENLSGYISALEMSIKELIELCET